jgi:hypothetical protein
LLVGVIRRGFFDLAEEVLLDVELTNVRDCAALDGVVREEFRAMVNNGFAWLVRIVKAGYRRGSLLWRWLARPT